MLRVPNIVTSFLFFYHILLHKVSTDSVKWQENYAISDEVFANLDFEWKCESNPDCSVAASTCANGTCQCPAGHIFNNNMTSCVKVATTYADECRESIQCSRYLFNGGTCSNATCECAEGYYYKHGRCIAYSGLFEKCRKNDDCYVTGDFEATHCDNGICKCSPGYYQREYRSCRRKAKGVGDKCVIDKDCKFFDNNAFCDFNNVCRLTSTDDSLSKYVHDTDYFEENNIREDVDYTINCTTDSECKQLEHAYCHPIGICTCERAHFLMENINKCVPELGEPCNAKDPINIPYSECRNGAWYCQQDRAVRKDNRKCEKVIKKYNNNCNADIWCSAFGPDAVCQNNSCLCNDKSRFNETELFCWTKRGIDETCEQDIDCYIDDVQVQLSCKDNVCSCPDESHPNSNRTGCLRTSASIGDECELDSDCIKENTNCVKEVCSCAENYYELNNECLAGIRSNCTENDDCQVDNSECASGNCICNEGYVVASTGSCIPVVSFGEPCEKDIQCNSTIPNSICSSEINSGDNYTTSVCVCAENHHYKFNKCFKRKVLGMKCESLGECYLDDGERVVCKNGRCACDWGYAQANDTVCKAALFTNANSGTITTISLYMSMLLLLVQFLMQ